MESVVKKIKIIQCQSCVNQCPKILSAVYKSAIIPPTSFHPPTTSHEPQATSPYPLSPPRPVFTSLFDIHYSIFIRRRRIYPPQADLCAAGIIQFPCNERPSSTFGQSPLGASRQSRRWTQAGLSQMFTSRKDLPKYTPGRNKTVSIPC